MAWWDRFVPGRRKSADGTLELFREVFGHSEVWAWQNVSLKTAIQVTAALACGRVISEGLAMLPWKVHRASGRRIQPATDHPLYDLLATAPNPMQTAFEFVETMGLHLAFTNNAYVLVERVGRRIDRLWLFEPSWVTVKYKFGELPTFKVRSPDGSVSAELGAGDVWHVRGPSWSSYIGLEAVHLARQALGLSMAIEEGQARLHARGAKVPGVLSVEGTLTDDQYKKLRAWLEKEHDGPSNAGRAMLLDRSAKWMSMALSNTDAQTLESRRFQIEEICRAFRVMPIMVGHADKTATYASAEQMFIAHAVHTLGPWIRRLELSANLNLLSPADRAAGLYTKLNEKAMQRMTARDQIEFLSRAVLNGILTRNEARELLERDPIDGLDEPLTPTNTTAGDPPDPGAADPPRSRPTDPATEDDAQ